VLVGRDELLELAQRRLGDVAEGRGQFLLLAGDAGIGKTRLLGAIERRAAMAGFRTATGSLAPQDEDVPGAVLLDLARSMRRDQVLAPVGQALLDRLADPGVDIPVEPGRRRRLLVLDVVDALCEAAAGPNLLAFEDLHWADDLSLEILAGLARRLRDAPVLVVATYRMDELATRSGLREWRARLLTQRQAEEVRLAPLTPEATSVMVRVLVGGDPLADEIVAAIHERTDGIPLHIEELVGVLAGRVVSSADDVRAARVPDTIESTILERLRRRSEGARRLASVGAVIGRRFVPAVVAGIVARPVETLEAPLRGSSIMPSSSHRARVASTTSGTSSSATRSTRTSPRASGGTCTVWSRNSGRPSRVPRTSTPPPTTSWPASARRPSGRRWRPLGRRPGSRPIVRPSSSIVEPPATCPRSFRRPSAVGSSKSSPWRRRLGTRSPPQRPRSSWLGRPSTRPARRWPPPLRSGASRASAISSATEQPPSDRC
jgi:hypothetical protein